MKVKFLLVVLICVGLSAFKSSEERKIHLYLVGDSTMANKSEKRYPETGWGMVFQEFFKDRVVVENHALNGRSSKSFIGEGHWAKVLNKLQPGDYVFIQFGHNDQKERKPDRYTNPVTTYRANLERYVRETREKGAHPILLSSVVRRNFNDEGTLIDTHGLYPLITRIVSESVDVPFIDLQLMTEVKVVEMGTEKSQELYMCLKPGEYPNYPDGNKDNTHFNNFGARVVAKMVVDELKKKNILITELK
ncbi:rhamnogalacturonan acetylesterase [Sunxiuqinia indica]|uniref:rhamnogalacturonan acetylesterase n=1 Tax=Sunxiuqinia indica TaxID=2692584 RepID=UPI00135749A2|nr:rhamnogalacturonan acetylesterase [Sunxiuqinia indica]